MLLNDLQNDLKEAQLAKDEMKVSTVRMLLSEIHNLEIQKGGEVSEEDLITVLGKEVKKRKEAAEAFKSGGRAESAQKEEDEMKILEGYLPTQLSSEELTKIVEDTITELGASGMADCGKVIGAVMGKTKGTADGGSVSALVKQKLS